MTKLTTGLAQELYDRYYIGESRPPGWIAKNDGVSPSSLKNLWGDMGLKLRDQSEALQARHMVGTAWSWDATEREQLSLVNPARRKNAVHEIHVPADGLPVRLLLVVGNVRLEIEVGK